MMTESLHENNRLIRKTILRMYPGNFLANLTINVAMMVDTLLAGALLGQEAIAAVAIGLPAIGIFQALLQAIVNGTSIKMAVHAGRGDRQKLNGTYSLGILATAGFGLVFTLVCLLLASVLTKLFGGAENPAVAALAALYLRACCVCVLMGSLNTLLLKILVLYGLQKEMITASLIALFGNLLFSVLYIHLLPSHLAIAGLGVGTWTGGTLACLYSLSCIKRHGIPLKFRMQDADPSELPGIVRNGLPTTGNKLMDNVVAGIINNLIISGFGGDTTALSVYTAVCSVVSFCDTSLRSIQTSIGPLLGILYGSRDRNGIVRTVKEGFKLGLLAAFVWGILILLALPLLAQIYGMAGNPHFRTGVIFGLLTLPLWLVIYLFTQTFEATENAGLGLLFSSVPDSVVYPVMLALLLPVLKYNGIWISFNCCAVPFLLALYLIRSAKYKTLRLSWDGLLCLNRSIRDNVPMLDISIKADNTDVTGISRTVHSFLQAEGIRSRTAYMTALCLEELAADFVEHTMRTQAAKAANTIMDIKLFSDEDSLKIIIRNAASRYNPLDFALDGETFSKVGVKLVQKVCRKIEYTYVYRMNIVTIGIDK